jgi:hypothetical protein
LLVNSTREDYGHSIIIISFKKILSAIDSGSRVSPARSVFMIEF